MEADPIPIDKVTLPGYDTSGYDGEILGKSFLYRWDGEKWSRIEGSCFNDYPPDGDGYRFIAPATGKNLVLILSATDVWTRCV